MKKALLIIDVQNDYFPGGKHELFEPDKALNQIQKLIEYFRNNDEPIYYVQHISGSSGTFFLPNTEGCEIHNKIKPQENDKIIIKHHPSSFLDTNLQAELQKDRIEELIICGMMTHMCVDTTVRVAQNYNYKVKLITDACATRDLKINNKIIKASVVQDTFLASLEWIFAELFTCEDYLEKINTHEIY